MDIIKSIVAQILAEQLPSFSIPELEILAQNACMQILQEIQAVIRDDDLDDPACFAKIEKIVCILEEKHIDCGARHDFG